MNWKLIDCDDPGSSDKVGRWPREVGSDTAVLTPVLTPVKTPLWVQELRRLQEL